jgi:hypothetical protein
MRERGGPTMITTFGVCAALVAFVFVAALMGAHRLNRPFLVGGCVLLGAVGGVLLGVGGVVLYLKLHPDPGGFAGFAAYPSGLAGAVLGAVSGGILGVVMSRPGGSDDS